MVQKTALMSFKHQITHKIKQLICELIVNWAFPVVLNKIKDYSWTSEQKSGSGVFINFDYIFLSS